MKLITFGFVCFALTGYLEICTGASIGFEGSISTADVSQLNLGVLDKLNILAKSNEISKDLKSSIKTLLVSITKNGVNPLKSIVQDALNQTISDGQNDLKQITQFLEKLQANLAKIGDSLSKPFLNKLSSALNSIQENLSKNSAQIQKILEKGLKSLLGQIGVLKNLLLSGLNDLRNLSLPANEDLDLTSQIDELVSLIDSGKLNQTLAKIASSVKDLGKLTFTQSLQLLTKIGSSTVQSLAGSILGALDTLFNILFLPLNLL